MYIIEVSSEEEFHFMEHEISDALQPPNPKQAKPKQAASPNVTPPRKKVQSPSTPIVRPDHGPFQSGLTLVCAIYLRYLR